MTDATKGKGKSLQRFILAAVLLALAFLLPYLTAQIPFVGRMLAPMHIPILLCGFLCGWKYGAGIGFTAPLLRSLLLGMPPFLIALSMAFELAAYGTLAGFLYQKFPKNAFHVYSVLVLSMLGGRLVWGIASYLIYQVGGNSFTLAMFFAGAFAEAIPGIIVHILLIPPVVLALRTAGKIP